MPNERIKYMTAPATYRFNKHHAWADKRDNLVYVGVSDHAQKTLNDIVFADIPSPGQESVKGQPLCLLESIKAVSDVIAPISGVIIRLNEVLDSNPGAINKDPYGTWIAAIEPSNPQDWDDLLTEEEYINITGA